MAVGVLSELRVSDAMHPGLISCSPQTPLRTVARMMSGLSATSCAVATAAAALAANPVKTC